VKKHLFVKAILIAFLAVTAGGCGAVMDFAQDNELRWKFLNSPKFISPARLRVGVFPFHDEAGLGSPEAGSNLARLLSEELAKNSRLEVTPVEKMAAALNAWGFQGSPHPAQLAQLGSDLRLNAVVFGSVSEISTYSRRKGWRRLARFFTSQRDYVDAVLAVNAVDSATGIILVSRANVGKYDGGPGEKQFFEADILEGPSQEAMEGSLDAALADSVHRTLEGLANLPFKVRIVSAEGETAVIAFGRDVGLKKGQEFVRLEVLRTITNTIGETYQVMGAASARLKVVETSDHSAVLELAEGQVYPGDVVQAVN
jgi:curli biogenesis system outer membrane secretion channel CsgG